MLLLLLFAAVLLTVSLYISVSHVDTMLYEVRFGYDVEISDHHPLFRLKIFGEIWISWGIQRR